MGRDTPKISGTVTSQLHALCDWLLLMLGIHDHHEQTT
jgi:hypothetical protein